MTLKAIEERLGTVAWQSCLPAEGVPYGLDYVTHTAAVNIQGQPVVLYRMSSGKVLVGAGNLFVGVQWRGAA